MTASKITLSEVSARRRINAATRLFTLREVENKLAFHICINVALVSPRARAQNHLKPTRKAENHFQTILSPRTRLNNGAILH